METLTALANLPEDWRETMPVWAHLVWALMRRSIPDYRNYSLVSFAPVEHEDGSNGGYVTIRLENVHMPSEYRTVTRYLSDSWL